MGNRTSTDNIYKVGAIITAKVDPGLKLVIVKYYERIYYCAVFGDPDRKHLSYFERELITPKNYEMKDPAAISFTKASAIRKSMAGEVGWP